MRPALALFAGALAVHAGYLLVLRRGFRRAQQLPVPAPTPDRPASIIVAARNEADRMGPLMAALSAQTHQAFEVVAVDDGSQDATPEFLRAWAGRDAHVQVLTNIGLPGKKGALATGIAAARHDVLLRTDADCAPSPGWASALAGYLPPETPAVVIGYAAYQPEPGLLNRLVRYEMLVTGWLMAAAAGLGRPYMAMGANIGHTRAAWQAVGGFHAHADLVSGDDDLFVQAAHRAGVHVVPAFGPNARILTEAPPTWRAWLHQKRRHLSDGRAYPGRVQVHLAAFHGSGHVLWLAPLALGWTGAALLAGRIGLTAWALAPATRAFDERGLLARLPLLELGFALYHTFLPALSLPRLRRW